jgi:hypothetical protein
MRGFTLVRVLGGLIALAVLASVGLVLTRPAHAQGAAAHALWMSSGPASFGKSGRCRCAFYLPAVQRNGGGGGARRFEGFFDVFAEFADATGNHRVKVQFHWDRTSETGNMTTVDITPTEDGFTWQVDREPPTTVRLNGLPPGEPVLYSLAPSVRIVGLRNTDAHPTASVRVINIGSSGQDGYIGSFFDVFLE